jgi:hypothetical protein
LGLPARKRAPPPISSRFTCTSFILVYCISCSRCGMLYIGGNWKIFKDKVWWASACNHWCLATDNKNNG